MDLSDLQTTNSTESLSSDISDTSSMIIPFKRDIVLSTYRHQNFTHPNSMMYYIAKNPKNSDIYQKMVKICKYFFIKNPILVISKLYYNHDGWGTWKNDGWNSMDMNRILAKVWITDKINVYPEDFNNNFGASSIIPKIYQCNFKHLFLHDQIISLNELIFLCSSVKTLNLEGVTVKNDDGTVVLFENVIEKLPQLKEIYYTFTTPPNNISKNTFKELWKNPHLSNYDDFDLNNIPEIFDIESFYSFMKKNKNTKIFLSFSDQISGEHKTHLEAIIDEIIKTKNHEYKPPFIEFPGLVQEKIFKLYAIFDV